MTPTPPTPRPVQTLEHMRYQLETGVNIRDCQRGAETLGVSSPGIRANALKQEE